MRKLLIVMGLVMVLAGISIAANVEVKLDSGDGSSGLEIKQLDATAVATFDSGGGLLMRRSGIGGATVNFGQGIGMMWYPLKAAFRAGGGTIGTEWNHANIGQYSIASGYRTVASGINSISMGSSTTASGNTSIALGDSTTASNTYSIAMGFDTTSTGYSAAAIGFRSAATAFYSTAMGYYTSAEGDSSVAIGRYCRNSTPYSLGIGYAVSLSNPDILFNPEGDCYINPSSGGLGVGTIGAGGYKLYVTDTIAGYVARFSNSDTSLNAKGICIKCGPDVNPGTNNNFILFEDGNGTDVGAVEGNAGGGVTYKTTGGDYAEYFDAEEAVAPGYLVGLNPTTGKARKWQKGDPFIGIVSTAPGFVGNKDDSSPASGAACVALVGQVDLNDRSSVIIGGINISTTDGQKIGYLLSNGKVFICRN